MTFQNNAHPVDDLNKWELESINRGFHEIFPEDPPEAGSDPDNSFLNVHIKGWRETDQYLLFSLRSATLDSEYKIDDITPDPADSTNLLVNGNTGSDYVNESYWKIPYTPGSNRLSDPFSITINLSGSSQGKYKFTKKATGEDMD